MQREKKNDFFFFNFLFFLFFLYMKKNIYIYDAITETISNMYERIKEELPG